MTRTGGCGAASSTLAGMGDDDFVPWGVTAVNLPEHAGNPIHTDDGARAAGYPSALVAGVSVYAYLTHLPAARWGLDWVRGGGAEVRFANPVFAGDRVECAVADDEMNRRAFADDDSTLIEARVGGERRATIEVVPEATAGQQRIGELLDDVEVVLDGAWADYGKRAGDDLDLYQRERIVHPAAWVSLANHVAHTQVVSGSWIHVRSRIVHQGEAPIGATARIVSSVVDRFTTRAGDRAILDVRIVADDRPVVSIEHEAIVALR